MRLTPLSLARTAAITALTTCVLTLAACGSADSGTTNGYVSSGTTNTSAEADDSAASADTATRATAAKKATAAREANIDQSDRSFDTATDLDAGSAADTSSDAGFESNINTELVSGSNTASKDSEAFPGVTGTTPLGPADTAIKSTAMWLKDLDALTITNIRIGSHSTYERIVFDIEGEGTPVWMARMWEEVPDSGSSGSIPYKGNVAILLSLQSVKDSSPRLPVTPGVGGMITEVKPLGVSSGMAEYIIGLDAPHGFAIDYLTNPSRVVIDIAR